MSRYERWNSLLELLAENGRLDVEEAAQALDVSAATIRRDLDELARQQMVTRTRGGAVAHNVSYDLPLRYKTARHAGAKQRIGAAAAALIAPGEVVGLNGGTTTTEVARALAVRPELVERAEGAPGRLLTIVTNALNIANELTVRPQVKIVVTGGVARPQSYELIGPLANAVLDELTLDVTVLGVDAVDVVHGATAHHEGEASVNRLLAERARRVVVVADSSKLGRRVFARICGLDRISALVTDAEVDEELAAAFTEAGVQVITA
ncbi:transcriptional regulator [Kitasatospora herbaricolor]|uniref:DeoR/GlpR family DNA-binding transcription regulator n=1 Tax=Kitasatospora herbaricolor TaxID=68217 RepID=UPI00174DF4F1|nr:DeoR/GlpR family DNA-binding transcription regulator [Kitasatospora herbaricolor]MDQ0310043.1 DeoR family transcriptional regulator of aga operon [Kitasatospora herbaricolor]GGV17556.1 transcriptional regulator [Kitasatospora herbaricolor]